MTQMKGRIKAIGNPKTFGDQNQYKSTKFWADVDLDTKYPSVAEFDATGKVDMSKVKAGDDVNIDFNIKGRKWKNPKTNKESFFQTLSVWKIEKVGGTPHVEAPPEDDSDLPF